jgi:hypothetical protein
MGRLAMLPFHLAQRVTTQVLRGRPIRLSRITLRANRCQVVRIVGPAAGVGLDVINAGPEIIEERGQIPPPIWIAVRKGSIVALFSDQTFQVLHGGWKAYRPLTPPAEPTITLKNLHLDNFGRRDTLEWFHRPSASIRPLNDHISLL